MVKFSVIIPAYNCYNFIPDAIDSVLSQTYKDYEVIVVDDGSTDRTPEVLSEYSDHIKIHRQKNQGVSVARNTGAKLANGEYLAFLDSDDIWLENKLERQCMKINSGFRICYSNRFNFGEVGDLPSVQTDIIKMPEGFIYEKLLFGNMITTSSVVIEKNIFESIGGFDTGLSYCEDWDFWLKCAEKYDIGVNSEPLVKYRLNSNSLSHSYMDMISSRQKVIESALGSEVGMSLLRIKRKKILAATYCCSAWEAAKSKDNLCSCKYFIKSLVTYPYNLSVWYDFLRLICGKI